MSDRYSDAVAWIVAATEQLNREQPRSHDRLWERVYWRVFRVWPQRTALRHAEESIRRFERLKQLLHERRPEV